jgi:hypothetical protein
VARSRTTSSATAVWEIALSLVPVVSPVVV